MTQCRKEEMSAVMPEANTVRMTVTASPGSKTDITPAGAITWSSGDILYVGYNGKYVGCLTLQGAGGSATGTFSGDVALTGITDGTEQTFHFYYLGSAERTLSAGATTVDVDFSSQDGSLANASAQHVGYGSAKGTVTDGIVTGINVTLVSKVALARFSFTKGGADYTDALTLSGTNIFNKMTVNFDGTFKGKTTGNITLGSGNAERYVMLVPTGDATEQTLTFTGSSDEGEGKVPGLESNKFYGKTEPIAVTLTASAPTHEYVDLGLSVKWATCNLGAEHPYDYGDYYQWGGVTHVTSTEINVGWAGCPFTNGTYDDNEAVFTKYVPQDEAATYGYGGFYDDKIVLDADDDAATVAWGSGWRMPTEAEFTELIDNTTRTWYDEGNTEFNGVAGWKCANKSDATKYIFLPAAGYRDKTSLNTAGSYGYYWSSSLDAGTPEGGRNLRFKSNDFRMRGDLRYYGCTVRPVCPPQN
ncbi:MAG: fibrobacter succinogenes major paralogous domain-containing protein [Bacteroidales bacterium]|nr:fibrobacter succinogenes major paralogous domain-containing protein [Bacteroidales bacterium]